MSTIVIQPAGPSDAADLARVRVAAWRNAYRGIVPAAELDGMDERREEARWRARLAAPSGAWTRVAWLLDSPLPPRLVGFAVSGPGRHEGEGAFGEVYAIYVDPAAQHLGAGRALMDSAIRGLVVRGYGEAVLWVFEANTAARGFYERMGWFADGAAKPFSIGGANPIELRFRRRIP